MKLNIIIKEFSVYAGIRFISMITSLISFYIFAKYASIQDISDYIFLSAFLSWAPLLFILGLDDALSRFLSRKNYLIIMKLIFKVGIFTLIFFIFLVIILNWFFKLEENVVVSLMSISLYGYFLSIVTIHINYLRLIKRVSDYIYISIPLALSPMIGISFYFLTDSIQYYFLGVTFIVLVLAIKIIRELRIFRINFRDSKNLSWNFFTFSLPSILSGV